MVLQRPLHCLLSAVLVLQWNVASAFYVPGVAPTEYKQGDLLDIKAVSMTSMKTQLPYEYYSLPFCPPEGEKRYKSLNLGEVLRGDRIVTTPYLLHLLDASRCKIVCKRSLTAKEVNQFIEKITHDYTVHMLADNLPAATVFRNLKTNELQYEDGFKLGFVFEQNVFLNNHLNLVIKYHPVQRPEGYFYRIVGFEIDPRSIAQDKKSFQEDAENSKDCTIGNDPNVMELKKDTPTSVTFSYSVQWEQSNIAWASRWDTYLHMSDTQIHWFAICNSIAIVFFLSGVLALIIIRTLRKDIARYNKDDEVDEAVEETGWKLVHGDVFRPPAHPTLLVASLGSGIQIFSMVLIVIVFAMFGMLSPANRGALMTAAIVLFMFMGVVAGYHGARMYRTLKGTNWKKAAAMTALFYPSIVFGTSFLVNFFIWGKHSSGAVPFTTMLALLFMWFGISFPLVFCGFYFGFRKQPYEHPVRTNQIPRQIPEQLWYLHPVFSSLIAGILPFGAVFVELFFIFTAIWENQFYYLFGFLFIVFVILIIACSEVAIVMTYFQLCGEDYQWWWRSFFISGSAAYYVLAYSIVYYYTKLGIEDFVPTLVYFSYTILMVITFWLLTGTIGFYSTYFFIRSIYAAVKQD